jgi:hypothetical protein
VTMNECDLIDRLSAEDVLAVVEAGDSGDDAFASVADHGCEPRSLPVCCRFFNRC